MCCGILPAGAWQARRRGLTRHQWADSSVFRSNLPSFLLPLAAWHLRLPPPVKECRLALEEFRCR
ncbi:hypothetical protein EJA05_19060 [Pseudomonas oryziphila]|uniref:Uncharacterized protein n=2 Tax=Pseudomonas TaxID=286 RepID=A0ABM7CTU2_9PSED|nr:hypothetical protein EJA05_19060 [Pseudomonas oryziphila]AZL74807.1 hypothetical protein EI693_17695 [Pseudomonas oryziphila]